MSKAYKITLGLLVVMLVFLTWLEANEPQEVNWYPSYSAVDHIPLGTIVLFENLKEQEIDLQGVNIPPFEFLEDSTLTGTYFFLNNNLQIDQNELKKILKWVEKGNTAFFIAESFSENLLDTFNLKTEVLVPQEGISSKPLLNLTHSRLKQEDPFLFDRETYQAVFSENDTIPRDILGETRLQSDSLSKPQMNFIRDTVGKGFVYLHLMPKAFSNYFLLDGDNSKYAELALAYLPKDQTLFWDHYYKSGKSFFTSPLYLILGNKALRWAYYFLLIGSVFFIIFEGRRKQRSIPVVAPLKNQTLDYTRTIAGLYLESGDYKSIVSKKISLFLDYVRSHYRLSTREIDDNFYHRLAALSENSVDDVKKLWQYMSRLQKAETISKEELLQLNKAIKAFKNQ